MTEIGFQGEPVRIGVIGGSGLYAMDQLDVIDEVVIETPFGKPSDAIIIGDVATSTGKRRVAFLPRHGRGHVLNPTRIPARANIWALKKLGVFWLTSVSAVGSLKEEIAPTHFVVPEQIIDRTRSRVNTFFDEIAVHAGFSYPFHPDLAGILARCAPRGGFDGPRGGNLRLHGGSALFDARRIGHAPFLGCVGNRDDGPSRGQARPRGRDVLRLLCSRDRLRRLA